MHRGNIRKSDKFWNTGKDAVSHCRALMHSGMGTDGAEVYDLLTWLECRTHTCAFVFILSIARAVLRMLVLNADSASSFWRMLLVLLVVHFYSLLHTPCCCWNKQAVAGQQCKTAAGPVDFTNFTWQVCHACTAKVYLLCPF